MKILNWFLITIVFLLTALIIWWQFYGGLIVKYRYEPIEGTILSARVGELTQVKDNSGEVPEFETVFRPEFVYEYQVGRIKYYGTRYRAFPRGQSKEWAEEIVRQNPAGRTVTVFFNPDRPERSTLSRELPANFDRNLVVTVLISLTLILVLYRELNKKDKREPKFIDGFKRLVPDVV